jgi:type IX secretion system PorP/SprF family membrane protein
MKKSVLTLLIGSVALVRVSAQDIHFTQFAQTPSNLSPALTGSFEGNARLSANYRRQWQSVPVRYTTFSGFYDRKLFHKALGENGAAAWGVVFNYDQAGDGELMLAQVGGSLAYTRRLGDQFFLTAGIQLLAGQRSVSPPLLTFEAQWNGDQYDPGKGNGENFKKTQAGLASTSAGLGMHYRMADKRTAFYAGGGLFHFNRPVFKLTDQPDVPLQARISLFLLPTIEVTEKIDLVFQALFSRQNPYREIVARSAVRYYLKNEEGDQTWVQLGAGWRLGDSFAPALSMQRKNWLVGLSYDVNTSPFRTATLRRGGPEISVQYIIWKVPPPKEFKACPVF